MHKRTLGWTCDGVQATTTCLPITFAALSLVVCTCDMLALSRMSRAGRHGPIHTRSAMQKSPSDYHCTFLKPKRGILQQLLWTLWVSTQELLVLQNSKAIKYNLRKVFSIRVPLPSWPEADLTRERPHWAPCTTHTLFVSQLTHQQ